MVATRRKDLPPTGLQAPEELARRAGLKYVDDDARGISRRRRGIGFSYRRPDGRAIADPAERQRIDSLAIPPAWTDVWICPDPRGHLQATGRDARGRKQYRYHPRWSEFANRAKFERMQAFGQTLPR
ncbi:MAG: DNA topoisomerase IB, partial [Planctomycetes bacterium]|nr:DNA topoisomerase IB [Planctomycetota bacterium]